MKKVMLILLTVLPLMVLAQTETEKISLSYEGQTTFRDQYLNPEGDTLVKVGAFGSNRVQGELFFGESNSQIGVFGVYQCSNALTQTYRARDLSGFNLGLSFRQNFGLGEIKIGAGYYRLAQKDYGYITGTTDTFSVKSVRPGVLLSGSILLTPETRIFPRIEISATQRFGFTNEYSSNYFENGGLSLKADVSLVRVILPIPEFYISPVIGFEKSEMTLNPIYKVGVEISGNYNVRANIVKVGYFRERSPMGVEGVFISINPTAVYLALK